MLPNYISAVNFLTLFFFVTHWSNEAGERELHLRLTISLLPTKKKEKERELSTGGKWRKWNIELESSVTLYALPVLLLEPEVVLGTSIRKALSRYNFEWLEANRPPDGAFVNISGNTQTTRSRIRISCCLLHPVIVECLSASSSSLGVFSYCKTLIYLFPNHSLDHYHSLFPAADYIDCFCASRFTLLLKKIGQTLITCRNMHVNEN